eukprot:GABV01011878.1.p1 GENE.GABV01011878.1~~GABV01011878.1.p1  ORF type:complete len:103 (-),score=32.34 GABV01011878.1:3-311(-)
MLVKASSTGDLDKKVNTKTQQQLSPRHIPFQTRLRQKRSSRPRRRFFSASKTAAAASTIALIIIIIFIFMSRLFDKIDMKAKHTARRARQNWFQNLKIPLDA